MNEWRIRNGFDPELFWSNDLGWTDLESADVFTDDEKRFLRTPIEGEWVASKIVLDK